MADVIINSARFNCAEQKGLCPVCGEAMKEEDRVKEGLHMFVWYKCEREGCDGQWLQKRLVWQTKHSQEPAAIDIVEQPMSSYGKAVSVA